MGYSLPKQASIRTCGQMIRVRVFIRSPTSKNSTLKRQWLLTTVDASTVAGLIVYSATTKDHQDRDGQWVTLKLWGRGAAQGNNAVLQYQRRQNDDAALGYVGTQPDYNPPQGVIPVELRIKREGDDYEAWFKPNAEGDWVSVGRVTNELQDPVEVGIYVGVADAEGTGQMTVTFDYFREASNPTTAVDPRDRLAVTWGELKRQ